MVGVGVVVVMGGVGGVGGVSVSYIHTNVLNVCIRSVCFV